MTDDIRHPAIVRLDAASADLVERTRLVKQLIEEQELLDTAKGNCARLAAVLADEARDVSRLEGVSFRRMVAAGRGTREADLDRERAEVDTAASALARAESERDDLQDRVIVTWRKVDRLGDAEAAYEQALAGLAQAADVSGAASADPSDPATTAGPRLDPVAVVRATNVLARRRERREVVEALSAGHEAMAGLADALESLRSADNWSNWDTFGGGGLLSSSIKHDRMDEAAQRITRAQSALDRFGRELDDLGLAGFVLPQTDGLTRGVDIFFDNIFTDFSVRSRIKDSLRSVEDVLGRVSETVRELEARQRELTPGGPLD